ncbi:hypothetical protein [Thermococcus stetteri]|uniref:hypothetical protein n=1 Tax=Thermococcus stetteri TaxID=49900 RepID=UPI001AE45B7D|nr:hypothetical protein [Thermococcus stetteri]MBP1912516.1 hypothetical protein [Thermococcus stetteri]
MKEEFSVNITNITGGGEYRIVITVRDKSGNERTFEYKTPYIRQYENFGKELYEKGIIVAASYMSSYQPFIFGKTTDDLPLLGRYVMLPIGPIDEVVLYKHVDWATGHGINVFFVDAGAWENWKIHGDEGAIMKSLMDKGIKCAFMWYAWGDYFDRGTAEGAPEWTIDLSNPKNSETFINQLKTIINSSLLDHPNYLG